LKRVFFTRHCQERLLQRRHKKFKHLDKCKKKNCADCDLHKKQIYDYINDHKKEINIEIRESLANGHEDRSLINNTEFMLAYYDRYGVDHHFSFIHHDDLMFVLVDNTVVTCVLAKGHISGTTRRSKFKKKDSHSESLWYN